MIRYPIFVFDGDDLMVYSTPQEHWVNLESYSIDYPDFYFDSDGRLLTKSDAGDGRVKISDSGANPDPERLRTMLIHALQRRGQEFDTDAPVDILIAAVQATRYEHQTLGQAISSLLRYLHLKRPAGQ